MAVGKLNATVNMKVNLAEIWDFFIEFMDWKTTSLKNADNPKEEISSYISIEMADGGPGTVIIGYVKSETQTNTYFPYFSKVDQSNKGIKFRGTYHELKAQELLVTIWKGGMFPSVLG